MVPGRATALAVAAVLLISSTLAACGDPDDRQPEGGGGSPSQPPDPTAPDPTASTVAGPEAPPPPTLPPLEVSAWWTDPVAGCVAGEVEAPVAPELAGLLVECQPADGSWRPRLVNVSDVSLSVAFWDDAYDAAYQGSSAGDDAWTSRVLTETGAGYSELYHWEGAREVGVSTLPAGDALSLTYTGVADGGDHVVTVAPDAAHTRAAFAVRTVSEVFDEIPWGDLGMDDVRWSHTVACAGESAAAMKDNGELSIDEAFEVSEACHEAVKQVHERYERRRAAAPERAAGQRRPPAVTLDELHGRVGAATRQPQMVLDDAIEVLARGAAAAATRGRAGL